jgi:hypothetical protein
MNCLICGWPIDPTLKSPHPMSASRDHIKQRAVGGSDHPKNIRIVHLMCNMRRTPRLRASSLKRLPGYRIAAYGPSYTYYRPLK